MRVQLTQKACSLPHSLPKAFLPRTRNATRTPAAAYIYTSLCARLLHPLCVSTSGPDGPLPPTLCDPHSSARRLAHPPTLQYATPIVVLAAQPPAPSVCYIYIYRPLADLIGGEPVRGFATLHHFLVIVWLFYMPDMGTGVHMQKGVKGRSVRHLVIYNRRSSHPRHACPACYLATYYLARRYATCEHGVWYR